MHDVAISPDRVLDPWEKNMPGLGLGRDPVRTPMQWEDGPNAGFSTGRPWLPIADDYVISNVAGERREAGSMLTLHRRLIALRRASDALTLGDYLPVETSGNLLAFVRQARSQRLLVVLNFGQTQAMFAPPGALQGRVLLSTHTQPATGSLATPFEVGPDEGLILELAERRG